MLYKGLTDEGRFLTDLYRRILNTLLKEKRIGKYLEDHYIPNEVKHTLYPVKDTFPPKTVQTCI